MKISILAMFFALISASSCRKNNAVEPDMNHSMPVENELMQSMSITNTAMNNAKLTNDFDYDFANLMLMHHQMAIDMSLVLIKNGNDQSIKVMANDIISAQESEIKMMQQFIKNYKIPVVKNQTLNSFKIEAEMKSMSNIMNAIKMTNNIDKDFVAMMIPHHESAVAMAKMQLVFGMQKKMLELAKSIIKNQTFEIEDFKKWQNKN